MIDKADCLGFLAYLSAAYPPRSTGEDDTRLMAEVWWRQLSRSEWLTPEMLSVGAEMILQQETQWLPSIGRVAEYLHEARRRVERRNGVEDAPALPGPRDPVGWMSGETPGKLQRCIDSGKWDRGYACGLLRKPLNRVPTTAEINEHLPSLYPDKGRSGWIKGQLENALTARLAHVEK